MTDTVPQVPENIRIQALAAAHDAIPAYQKAAKDFANYKNALLNIYRDKLTADTGPAKFEAELQFAKPEEKRKYHELKSAEENAYGPVAYAVTKVLKEHRYNPNISEREHRDYKGKSPQEIQVLMNDAHLEEINIIDANNMRNKIMKDIANPPYPQSETPLDQKPMLNTPQPVKAQGHGPTTTPS